MDPSPTSMPSRTHGLGFLAATAKLLVPMLALVGCANAPFPAEIENGKYNVRATGEPLSFDPSISYNAGDGPIVAMISPSFYRYKYLKRSPYQLELNLGAALPTVQKFPNAKKGETVERWTYPIRHDLRFQDDPCFPGGKGRAITAADFVYSFKRMADPHVSGPLAGNVSDKIVGWDDYAKGFESNKGRQYDTEMKGVYVDPKDPYSFVIDLNQAYPQLRFLMAMAFTTPQAREAVEKYGDQYALHHPVGCGTYMLKEYVAHDHVWLVRNPNAPKELYPSEADPQFESLLADKGKTLPFNEGLYFPVVTESVTSYNLFQQGYLDTLGISSSNAQLVPAANGLTADMKAKGIQLNKNVEVDIEYLAFNMEDPVFGGYTPEKRKLRQAISLSIDAGTYISVIQQGMGIPAQWIVPPGLAGYDPNYRNPYRQFDPSLKKAKQLLAEAGYPDGIDKKTGQRLVLHYDNYATSAALRQIARLYQKQIQALGIQVEMNTNQYSTFNDRLNKKQAQFYGFGWLADYPDAENFAFLFYGPNKAPGPNSSLYANPEYDKLFDQMRSMTDSPERDKIIAKMRDISVEDCPWIYVAYPETRTLVQPWIKNERYSPMASDRFKYVAVDNEMRSRLQSEWNSRVYWPIAAVVIVIIAVCIPASATIRTRTNRRLRKEDNSA